MDFGWSRLPWTNAGHKKLKKQSAFGEKKNNNCFVFIIFHIHFRLFKIWGHIKKSASWVSPKWVKSKERKDRGMKEEKVQSQQCPAMLTTEAADSVYIKRHWSNNILCVENFKFRITLVICYLIDFMWSNSIWQSEIFKNNKLIKFNNWRIEGKNYD